MAVMNQQRDIYGVLGVPHDADPLHIRTVYRETVRALRLDSSRTPEAEARLRELTHAYAVLSNPRSRLLYDRLALRRTGGGPGVGAPAREWPHVDDEDLSSWVFGEERRRQPRSSDGEASGAVDLLARYFATAGFVIAALFLVFVLLRG
jgi:curved DNA-binding protein CbpA